MSGNITDTILDLTKIEKSDICGLWEVIRISQMDEPTVIYPWVKNRFKFNFLPEMIFICLQNGQNSKGTWKLSEKIYEIQKLNSIILNETFEYVILEFSEDEIILSDHINKYLLVRRL